MSNRKKLHISVILNTLRILKQLTPGDTYYENYLSHIARDGDEFYDTYMLMWEIGSSVAPKRILEIGTRTGTSLCQLLSAYRDLHSVERIVSVDPFADPFLSVNLVKRNFKHLNLPVDKLEFMVEASRDALPKLIAADDSFGYILVDGDHSKSEARKDLDLAHQLLESGGILIFDDISIHGCDLLDVWQDFKGVYRDRYEFQEVMTGKGVAWAIKK